MVDRAHDGAVGRAIDKVPAVIDRHNRIQNSSTRMKPLAPATSLVSQAYDAILDEICDGGLPAGTHLVQEALADRLGVSRQPIQQALLLLRNDGVVQDAGRRGLLVPALDLEMMQHRYRIRAALDALAARLTAERCAASPEVARTTLRQGEQIIMAGLEAVDAGSFKDMIGRDVAFHAFLYSTSGNPVLGTTAQLHWPYLRRVMGEVLRRAEPPHAVWRQHRAILEAVVAGEADLGAARALHHVDHAVTRLAPWLGDRTGTREAAHALTHGSG
jgi:DNA-binding GntR family transcriptional regulator